MTYEIEDAQLEQLQPESAAGPRQKGERRAGPPRLMPIHVLHKRKAPMLTFELAADGLVPLAARALQRLPRLEGVPVLRGIAQEDGLGFAFQFRIVPRDLTAQAVPALLERWDEKFELAKAKAGLTVAPPPAAEPLKPRSPRRKRVDPDDAATGTATLGAAAAASMSVPDLAGIVQTAISAHDAQLISSLVAAPAAHAQSSHECELPEALPASPREHSTASAAARVTLASRDDATSAMSPGEPQLLGTLHIAFAGADGTAVATPAWIAWTHAVVTLSAQGLPVLRLDHHTVDSLRRDDPARADAENAQARAARWQGAAEAALVQSLDAILRVLPVQERFAVMRRALEQVGPLQGRLDVLLLDMQLCRQLAAAIDKQQLGMAGWALQMRQHLVASARAYERFHAAAGPLPALDLVDRWSAGLAPLRLTEQAGLFAQAPATHLQRQLQHLIDHARAWLEDRAPELPHEECARVLAVWATWALAQPPLVEREQKRTREKWRPGLLNRRDPGAD